jgi:hypothetical protein
VGTVPNQRHEKSFKRANPQQEVRQKQDLIEPKCYRTKCLKTRAIYGF